MSATNRGAVRSASDFYATPLTAFTPLIPYLPKVPTWEPACGDGRLVRAMNDFGIPAVGSDLNPCVGFETLDFLTAHDIRYSCIVTNPPYSLAQQFVDKAKASADEVFFLLRLNFLGAQCRKEWFKTNEPDAIFALSERPKFCKNKKGKLATDACEYGWFYWASTVRPKYEGIFHL